MSNKNLILSHIRDKKQFKTADIATLLAVSRQTAFLLVKDLLKQGVLVKIGSTKKASYILTEYAQDHSEVYPTFFKKVYKNKDLEEGSVLDEIEQKLPRIKTLPKNILQILRYGFLEMMNNAIEHSQTDSIEVMVSVADGELRFVISDAGVGVFRNVMKVKKLNSELEAIQDILKGKTTTAPENHSGQGIFFTSKMGDIFNLESFSQQLIVNNKIDDIFLKKPKRSKSGTRVSFSVSLDSKKETIDVFKKYSDMGESSDFGFDKTDVKVKLYTREGIYISRSQARRILVGLDNFRSITLDFTKVETIGQAFADEIFRVFRKKHPEISIIPVDMNENVKFMIDRVDR
ncbi:MAG: DUF4325 domain-containing protein [Patescibacteria group bacterium]